MNLLRRFPPEIDNKPVTAEEFVELAAEWRLQGNVLFGSWTSRKPRRIDELKGGSCYFVIGDETMFRMPLHGIERVVDFKPNIAPKVSKPWSITCYPLVVIVQSKTVRFLRGWRYLEDRDAPRDIAVL